MIQIPRPDPELSIEDRLLWLERNLIEVIKQHVQLTKSVEKIMTIVEHGDD